MEAQVEKLSAEVAKAKMNNGTGYPQDLQDKIVALEAQLSESHEECQRCVIPVIKTFISQNST